jgi:Flp pilus assembly protein TadB
MQASHYVQTTGINWESVGAIAALVGVILTVLLWIFTRQDKRRENINKDLRDDMTTALNHMADVLTAKLETKDTVARISERLARVEALVGVKSSTLE